MGSQWASKTVTKVASLLFFGTMELHFSRVPFLSSVGSLAANALKRALQIGKRHMSYSSKRPNTSLYIQTFQSCWAYRKEKFILLSQSLSIKEEPPGNLSLAWIYLDWVCQWVKWKSLSRIWLFATPWTIQCMEFSRPEYWTGWPFPSPGDLPNPGIEPRSPALQADSLPAEPQGKPRDVPKWNSQVLVIFEDNSASFCASLKCKQW